MKRNYSLYTGLGLSGLAVLFLLMDAGMKIAAVQASVEATGALGVDPDLVRPLGLVLAVSTLLYATARTSVLGAVLVTAYLGGAIAVTLQHHMPIASHTLFGVYIGLLVWGGLYLRMPLLRALFPFARHPTET